MATTRPSVRIATRAAWVAPAGAAVAAGPHAGHAGAAFAVGHDASALQRDRRARGLGHVGLADGLEHHVGRQLEVLAGLLDAAARARYFLVRGASQARGELIASVAP